MCSRQTITRILPLLFLSILPGQAQHKITLVNGDQLSGKLTDSDTDGVIFFDYSNSHQALKLSENSIKSIQFNSKNVLADGKHKERIKLTNGDEFPITLKSLNQDSVSFDTSYLGNHEIPRSQVSTIYFNNLAEDLIYKGPKKLSEWKQFGGQWSMQDGKLTCARRASISKNIENLTENFKLQFTTSWTEPAPNMRIYFSTDSGDISKRNDTYYIEINNSGQRIVKKTDNRLSFLGTNLVQPDTYTNNKAKFELFVDRKSKIFTLYIDDQKIKEFKDSTDATKGSFIILECLQRHNEKISFEDIVVSSWNGVAPSDNEKFSEALEKNDLILTTASTQMAGEIKQIDRATDNLNITLDIPFAKKPSIIPGSKIQTIHFKTLNNAKVDQSARFNADLSIGGNITYNKSKIEGDTMSINHPIIGETKIKLSSLHETQKLDQN